MHQRDFPALYRSADELSLRFQRQFYLVLRCYLILLVVAAIIAVVNATHWSFATLQLIVLLGVLACAIYLFAKRPDRVWFSSRAVAESIKTSTWRFACRAEPFQTDDAMARSEYQNRLRAIIEQNRDVARFLTMHLEAPQITPEITRIRQAVLEERKDVYLRERINDQLTWYAKKAATNRQVAGKFFFWLIVVNAVAVALAALKIGFAGTPYWPTNIIVAVAASMLTWMQAKRFSELSASYALAAHEISILREEAMSATTDAEFSSFVGDAENAFSREHTQWVARRDV